MHSVSVPHTPASAGLVRSELRSDLVRQGVPESLVDAAALVLSELIGNAVRHGHALPSGELLARWERSDDGALRLEVVDGGAGPAGVPAVAAADAESGRGLAMVDLLAARWGCAPADPGTTVWADLTPRGAALGGAS